MSDDSGFPTLKSMFNSYPAERVKAKIKEFMDSPKAARNATMNAMADDNKKYLGGFGGMEEITPETSDADKQAILDARKHLEYMNGAMDPQVVGGTANVPMNAAEAILAARAAGKSVAVVPEIQKFGKVIMQEPGMNTAEAILASQKTAAEPISKLTAMEEAAQKYKKVNDLLNKK